MSPVSAKGSDVSIKGKWGGIWAAVVNFDLP